MESYWLIVLIFGIIILLLLVGLFFINKLVLYKNRVELQFKPIKDELEQKMELLNHSIEFIKKEFEEEDSFIKELIQTKDIITDFIQDNSKIEKLHTIEKNSLKFMDLADIYPNLNKDKDFLALKEQLNLNHERIMYAIESYDREVLCYNQYREKKFIHIVAKIFHFKEYNCYNK